MIVVSDTSPINYLLLIHQIDLLPRLFERIIIPDAVCNEMLNEEAPSILQKWIKNPPPWLEIQTVSRIEPNLNRLDIGEQTAITLAQTLPADLLLIDERLGRKIAQEYAVPIIGTLGILDEAARQGWIDLEEVIAHLQQTNFRISRQVIQALLNKQ